MEELVSLDFRREKTAKTTRVATSIEAATTGHMDHHRGLSWLEIRGQSKLLQSGDGQGRQSPGLGHQPDGVLVIHRDGRVIGPRGVSDQALASGAVSLENALLRAVGQACQ